MNSSSIQLDIGSPLRVENVLFYKQSGWIRLNESNYSGAEALVEKLAVADTDLFELANPLALLEVPDS
jgi:hypothetical protein